MRKPEGGKPNTRSPKNQRLYRVARRTTRRRSRGKPYRVPEVRKAPYSYETCSREPESRLLGIRTPNYPSYPNPGIQRRVGVSWPAMQEFARNTQTLTSHVSRLTSHVSRPHDSRQPTGTRKDRTLHVVHADGQASHLTGLASEE